MHGGCLRWVGVRLATAAPRVPTRTTLKWAGVLQQKRTPLPKAETLTETVDVPSSTSPAAPEAPAPSSPPQHGGAEGGEAGKTRVGRRKKRLIVPRSPASPVSDEERKQRALRYAVAMLSRMPKEVMRKSSVIRGALERVKEAESGKPPENPAPLLQLPPQYDSAPAPVSLMAELENLQDSLAKLESKSRKDGTPRLGSGEEYLSKIREAKSVYEVVLWFDEVCELRPDWLSPAIFTETLHRVSNDDALIPERDVLTLWLKARSNGMADEDFYAILIDRMGFSTLRAVAFPLVWEAAKHDHGGPAALPGKIQLAALRFSNRRNSVSTGVGIFLDIMQNGGQLCLPALLEMVSLLASRRYYDQEVYTYLFEELQIAISKAVHLGGPSAIPKDFFVKALLIGTPQSAMRLWYFMVHNHLTVSYQEYKALIKNLVRSLYLHEASQVYQYLDTNHPEFLKHERGAIVKAMMHMYALVRDFDQCSYLFSTHFDVDGEGKGLRPTKACYITLLRSVSGDPELAHHIWREMLARGLTLQTHEYNLLFLRMGGSTRLMRKVEYSLPAGFDDSIPKEMMKHSGPQHEMEAFRGEEVPLLVDHSTAYDLAGEGPIEGFGRRDVVHESIALSRRPGNLKTIPDRGGPFWHPFGDSHKGKAAFTPFLAKEKSLLNGRPNIEGAGQILAMKRRGMMPKSS